MNILDYLIDPAGRDWAGLLAPWSPPLPSRFTVWLVNRLGEPFVLGEEGQVIRLDVGAGVAETVASSREQFARLIDVAENAQLWLRMQATDGCRAAGMRLGPSECFGFRLPPTLGGRYEPANLVPTRFAVHYSYQAYICQQKDIYWIPPALESGS
jgi:hypothetical protein